MVIFGITGDLARKMTFRALYRLERRGLLGCPIIGVARDELCVDTLRTQAREAIVHGGERVDDTVFDRLADRLSYLHGDVGEDALYQQLATQVGQRRRPLFYLEPDRSRLYLEPDRSRLDEAGVHIRLGSCSRSRWPGPAVMRDCVDRW